MIEEEDEDRLSNTSSYHSSISQNDINEDHQAILAKSLEELQRKLSRMEQELIIVGEESKELQTRICQRELDLSQKVYLVHIILLYTIFKKKNTYLSLPTN